MSPCIAAMYGMPPNMYGFHCGNALPGAQRLRGEVAERQSRAMYWSLCGLTRNWPLSAGYASASVASAYVSAARPIAKRGAGVLGAADFGSGRDIRRVGSQRTAARPVVRPEEKAWRDFEQRQPDA